MKKLWEMDRVPALGNRDEYCRVRARWGLKPLLSAKNRRARLVEAMATEWLLNSIGEGANDDLGQDERKGMTPPAGPSRMVDLVRKGQNRKVNGHLRADNRMLLTRLFCTSGKEGDLEDAWEIPPEKYMYPTYGVLSYKHKLRLPSGQLHGLA